MEQGEEGIRMMLSGLEFCEYSTTSDADTSVFCNTYLIR